MYKLYEVNGIFNTYKFKSSNVINAKKHAKLFLRSNAEEILTGLPVDGDSFEFHLYKGDELIEEIRARRYTGLAVYPLKEDLT